MKPKTLLGLQNGWGGAAGIVLLLAFGLFVLFISVADLREAARVEPEERDCTSWMEDPSGARWVTLVGCQLDLPEAASRRWKGWGALKDGGVSTGRYLELFIPLYAGQAPLDPPRAVLATSDQALLAFMDSIERLPPDQVQAYLKVNAAAVETLLQPKTLTGYVEPVKSLAARSALTVLTADDAVVLEQGRQPPRASALFGLLVGLLAVAKAVRSMHLRSLVERDPTL